MAHRRARAHEKNNILVYACSADSNVADCQVKNLVFANDYSKSNPSDIDWSEGIFVKPSSSWCEC